MTVIVNGNPIPANWFWPPDTDQTLRPNANSTEIQITVERSRA